MGYAREPQDTIKLKMQDAGFTSMSAVQLSTRLGRQLGIFNVVGEEGEGKRTCGPDALVIVLEYLRLITSDASEIVEAHYQIMPTEAMDTYADMHAITAYGASKGMVTSTPRTDVSAFAAFSIVTGCFLLRLAIEAPECTKPEMHLIAYIADVNRVHDNNSEVSVITFDRETDVKKPARRNRKKGGANAILFELFPDAVSIRIREMFECRCV